jgi:hypothetical protein
LVKLDCAGDADGFSRERGDPFVSRNFLSSRNKSGERLTGIFTSEIDK